MPDLSTKPRLIAPGTPPGEQPFDPSQLTDAKAQIEYLVNTGKMSAQDANQALKPYGAKLSLQAANRGRGPGGRDYYQITGNHSVLKEFVLPASIMLGGAVGLNLLAGALAGAGATPTLASGVVAPSGSVPAGLGGAGVSLAAPSAAVPAVGTSVGTGVGFGAGGTPIAGAAPTTMASGAGSTAAGSAGLTAPAAGGFSWGKALAGLGVDAFKTFMSNRTAGKTNDAIQKGNQQAIDLYKDALSPYMTLGANAAGAQNYLMGFPAGPATGPATGSAGSGLQGVTGRTMPAGATPTGTAVPRISTPPMADTRAGLSAFGRSPQAEAQQQTASSFQPVRMVLNGEEDWVHPSQVQAAQQQGAKLVGV